VTATSAGTHPAVVVARSVEELEPLREDWERLQGSHFATDPDVFPAILAWQPHAIRPHAVGLRGDDGRLRALVLARVEDIRLTTKIGYAKVYRPKARAFTVVYRGILGELSDADARVVVGELLRSLSGGEADVLRFRRLVVGSPVHTAASTATRSILRERRSPPTSHWELDVPDSYDAFLASLSRATREGAKRYPRRLEKEFGDRLTLEVLGDPADAERIFTDLRRVAEKTYQQGLGVAFAQDELRRRLTTMQMERGWFRAYVLYLDGDPVAFWQGHAYRGVFSTGVPGFDPALSNLRVGNYVLFKLIADLCEDEAMHTLDYGFGDAEYKRRFGTRSWEEQDLLLWAPTFKGFRTNAIRSSTLAAVDGASRVLERGDRLDRLKRIWRDRLQRG
jgi:CelD/BcsL family acetyltransferase involved in cellulose biosynthesis